MTVVVVAFQLCITIAYRTLKERVFIVQSVVFEFKMLSLSVTNSLLIKKETKEIIHVS